jgi:4'-phosphopantetheinyl transferase
VGLVAVTRGLQLGIDVETSFNLPTTGVFTSWVASPRETRELSALPPHVQADALLRLWTRKEALVKATGRGLGDGVLDVEVPLEAHLWETSICPFVDGSSWLVFELPPPRPEMMAALVTSMPHPAGASISINFSSLNQVP